MGQLLTWEEIVFESIPTFWDTEFADGNKFDLQKFESLEKDENSSEMVEFKDKFEYVKKCLLARLTIFTSQTNAIKEGINAIVPEALFNVGSFDDLETWICGSCTIDLELLKAHTVYPEKDEVYKKGSKLIETFWEVIGSFSEEDQRKFIQFCWAQNRLPINDSNFQLKIMPFDQNKEQDIQLPQADTCFFNFKLPKYSSFEIMRQKILKAINLDCITMNAEQQNFHGDGGDRYDDDL